MTFEGVDWNEVSACKKTEALFVDDGLQNGQYSNFKIEDQVVLLKEAYRLIKESQLPGG